MERCNKEQVKEKILDAVITCKYESTGKDIQVTQVAARSGISTRTLNRYFPDKNEMIYLAAVRFLERQYAHMSDVYQINFFPEDKNGMQRICMLLQMHADYYRQNPSEAAMVDSANLRYTLGALEKEYPKIQVGLNLRKIFLDNMNLGQQDGSIRKDLNPNNTWVLVSATYNGLLHRLANLKAMKCEMIDRNRFFQIYDEYITMIKSYLKPIF